MWYEILKVIVLIFGPIIIYTALRVTLQVPELITGLPAAGRRAIEAAGALLIAGSWFVAYVAPFSGAMALIGLVLLATPLVAHKMGQSKAVSVKA